MIIQTGMRTDIPALSGADCSGCMTVKTFETALHERLDVPKRKMNCHDPKSPFLLGGNQPGDAIHEAVQKSWIDRQMRLELPVMYPTIRH